MFGMSSAVLQTGVSPHTEPSVTIQDRDAHYNISYHMQVEDLLIVPLRFVRVRRCKDRENSVVQTRT